MNAVILFDVFKAYKLNPINVDTKELYEKTKSLKNFDILYKAVTSDRKPETIVNLANELGMYISERIGINVYNYFIQNFYYYQDVEKIPFSKYFLHISDDPVKYLLKFNDFVLMKLFNFSFTTRMKFIKTIIKNMNLISLPCSLDHDHFKCFKINNKYVLEDDVEKHCENLTNLFKFYKGDIKSKIL